MNGEVGIRTHGLYLVMVDTQAALCDLAAQQGDVASLSPFFTAGPLMCQAEIHGTTLAEWFKGESRPVDGGPDP